MLRFFEHTSPPPSFFSCPQLKLVECEQEVRPGDVLYGAAPAPPRQPGGHSSSNSQSGRSSSGKAGRSGKTAAKMKAIRAAKVRGGRCRLEHIRFTVFV